MLGMTNGFVSNTSATPITGLLWLAVVVTFGIRRPGGALLGGLAVMATTPIFRGSRASASCRAGSTTSRLDLLPSIMFGLGAINLAKNPDGLFALIGAPAGENAVASQDAQGAHRAGRGGAAHGDAEPDAEPVDEFAARDRGHRGAVPESRRCRIVPTTDDGRLELDGIVAGYGDVEVLHGVDARACRRAASWRLLGANGAGQVDAVRTCRRPRRSRRPGRILLEERDVTADKVVRAGAGRT